MDITPWESSNLDECDILLDHSNNNPNSQT